MKHFLLAVFAFVAFAVLAVIPADAVADDGGSQRVDAAHVDTQASPVIATPATLVTVNDTEAAEIRGLCVPAPHVTMHSYHNGACNSVGGSVTLEAIAAKQRNTPLKCSSVRTASVEAVHWCDFTPEHA